MRLFAQCWQVLVTVGLFMGTVQGQLTLRVEMPKQQLILGEPAYLRLVITNIGQQPKIVSPIWAWNWRWINWLKAKKVPIFPCFLEKWGERGWEEVPRSRWARPLDGFYGSLHTPDPPSVLLEPGESFEVWWDIQWQYELSVGEYRVKVWFSGYEPWGLGQEVVSDWIRFSVKEPIGKVKEEWEKYAPMREKYKSDRWWYGWLNYAKLEDLQETTYFPWGVYLRVQETIAFPTLPSFFVELPYLEDILAERYNDFPLKHRVKIYWQFRKAFPFRDLPRDLHDTALKELMAKIPVGSPEWWRRVRQLIADLIEWQDLEWASLMVDYVGWRTYNICLDRQTLLQFRHDDERVIYFLKSLLGEQGRIWWSLPKSQRPSKEVLLQKTTR